LLRVSLVLGLTVLADVFLFGHPLGVGVTLFALTVALACRLHRGVPLRAAGPWPWAWMLLAAFASVESSVVGIVLLVTLGWALLATEEPRSLYVAFMRGLGGGLRPRFNVGAGPTWVFLLPAALTLLFAVLLVPANLVLSNWVARVSLPRALFWAAIFVGVSSVLRFLPGLPPLAPRTSPGSENELRACLGTFLGVNVVFLAVNLTDVFYLWGGFTLPADLSYSAYAHHGAYRLIAAVALAAATVVLFFRTGARQMQHTGARFLVLLFVAQNIFVLAGAGRRLFAYAAAYGLTPFRVAVVFWLVLVVTGLVLLALRIVRNRPLRFLQDGCAAATVIVLALWTVADIDGFVAGWNVDRHLENGASVDVEYLGTLGPGALPALARLAGDARSPAASRARDVLVRRLFEEMDMQKHPFAATIRRKEAIRAARESLKPR